MNAQTAFSTETRQVVPLVAAADSRPSRNCPGLMATLGFAALLSLAQTDSALAVATAPPLGTTQSFGVLAGASVTNTGFSVVRGDLGLSPGTAVSGFPPGVVVPPGTLHVTDAVAAGAQNDATIAYNNLAGQACDFGPFGPTDLAGQVLVPGVYCFSSSVNNSGALTLNGSATDVWVFKIGTALTTGPGSSVVGSGGKCNVFWQVGSSATLDTTTTFRGTIIALESITMNNGASLNGRALARNGSVTLINNSFNNTVDPTGCAGVAPPGGVGATAIFSPANLILGGVSTKTITLSNADPIDATITSFTDNLPTGLLISSPSNASNTCGGALSAPAGGSTVSMTGGTIPQAVSGIPGACTITLNVVAVTPGTYANELPAGALVTSNGTNAAASSAVLVGSRAEIPTLSQWAMIALTVLLALAGFAAMRRRKS